MHNHLTTVTTVAAFFWAALSSIAFTATGWPQAPALAGFLLLQAAAFAMVRRDPVHHWPVAAIAIGQLPLLPFFLPVAIVALASFWIIPLAAVLKAAYQRDRDAESVVRASTIGSLREGFEGHRSQHGQPLNALADASPVLLVFVRHAGCTFCRQTLADLSHIRKQLETNGVAVVIVHQSSEEAMNILLERYGLLGVALIGDPQRLLYRHFGLEAGSWWQVANPWVVWKSAISAFWERHGLGRPDGDPRQMSGVFAVVSQRVQGAYFHRFSSDRPDLARIASRLNIS